MSAVWQDNKSVWQDNKRFRSNEPDGFGYYSQSDGYIPPPTRPAEELYDRNRYRDDPYYTAQQPASFPNKYAPEPIDLQDTVNDCEIIVVEKHLRAYAELVEQRLKTCGLRVDILFPNLSIGLEIILKDLSLRGISYGIIITEQHKERRSITVNILRGSWQEHKNMPLDDAIALIAKDFENAQSQRREPVSIENVSIPNLPPRIENVSLPEPPLQSDVKPPYSESSYSAKKLPYEAKPVLTPEKYQDLAHVSGADISQSKRKLPASLKMIFNILIEERDLSIAEFDKAIQYLTKERDQLAEELDVPTLESSQYGQKKSSSPRRRGVSPKRMPSPKRRSSPKRRFSPGRAPSPPKRTASPRRGASPSRTTFSRKRSASPPKTSFRRRASPPRQESFSNKRSPPGANEPNKDLGDKQQRLEKRIMSILAAGQAGKTAASTSQSKNSEDKSAVQKALSMLRNMQSSTSGNPNTASFGGSKTSNRGAYRNTQSEYALADRRRR